MYFSLCPIHWNIFNINIHCFKFQYNVPAAAAFI